MIISYSTVAEAADQCGTTPSCESLGYKLTIAQCAGKKYITCPLDLNKVFCGGFLIGEIKPHAGKTIPPGWVRANGQSLPSSTYKELYNAIRTTYGGTNSNFKVPNLSGRFPYGSDTRGSQGGEAKHALTINEMPQHQHIFPYGESEGTGSQWGYEGWRDKFGAEGSDTDNYWPNTSYVGDNLAHENMPPYYVVDYIIFTGVY